MKKIEKYVCEFCGDEFDSKEECERCEKRHIKPIGIETAKWVFASDPAFKDYPFFVGIKMDDGSVVKYYRRRGTKQVEEE